MLLTTSSDRDRCAFCGEPFIRVDPLQKFCGKPCRKKFHRPRKCPHPEKIRYRSKTIAIEVCSMNKWRGQTPYPCACGWWHTRSDWKEDAKKANRRIHGRYSGDTSGAANTSSEVSD